MSPHPRILKYLISILITLIIIWILSNNFILRDDELNTQNAFNGHRAYNDIKYQVDLGPRIPGSDSHDQIVEWLEKNLRANGWDTEIQEITSFGHDIKNVIAKRGSVGKWLILGAHYDSRIFADRDQNYQQQPVPGANDGASGVSVLLELARVIPKELNKNIWLVFFDAEDNGGIKDWDWVLGSQAFVLSLDGKPDSVVIVDMVGDADLNLHIEANSDINLVSEIWEYASRLGYAKSFIPTTKHAMIDDHIPFIQANIPAIDIIDFDYPYCHTTEDTIDKVSAESLQTVGDVLLAWITDRY